MEGKILPSKERHDRTSGDQHSSGSIAFQSTTSIVAERLAESEILQKTQILPAIMPSLLPYHPEKPKSKGRMRIRHRTNKISTFFQRNCLLFPL